MASKTESALAWPVYGNACHGPVKEIVEAAAARRTIYAVRFFFTLSSMQKRVACVPVACTLPVEDTFHMKTLERITALLDYENIDYSMRQLVAVHRIVMAPSITCRSEVFVYRCKKMHIVSEGTIYHCNLDRRWFLDPIYTPVLNLYTI